MIDDWKPLYKARALVETVYEWRKWHGELPYIQFPSDWLVKAIPPFGGAVVRYNIKHKYKPDSFVSVYLDCYDELGIVGEPYWEVYPIDDTCERCSMLEIDKLLELISTSLEEQK